MQKKLKLKTLKMAKLCHESTENNIFQVKRVTPIPKI